MKNAPVLNHSIHLITFVLTVMRFEIVYRFLGYRLQNILKFLKLQ